MEDEELIRADLNKLPSSFNLKGCFAGKSKDSIDVIISRLQSEIKNGIYELNEEWVRTYNLVSFLYLVIGKTKDAKTYNEKVLEIEEHNMIASTNLVWYNLELQDAYEVHNAYKHIEELKQSQHFQAYYVKAEAEIAYCFTRLGLRYQETAENKCKDVLAKANVTDVDKNSVMLWMYGLGLILKRLSKLASARTESQTISRNKRRKDAIKLFIELVTEEWDSKRLKAMALIQLGELSYTIAQENLRKTDFFPEPYSKWYEEKFYKAALQLSDKETYVLERYGKFLRYKKKYNESETTLRKSLGIRPTSFAHHHLALTLKSKLSSEIGNQFKYSRSNSGPVSRVNSKETGGHVRNLFHGRDYNYSGRQDSYVSGADVEDNVRDHRAQSTYVRPSSGNRLGKSNSLCKIQNVKLDSRFCPFTSDWNYDTRGKANIVQSQRSYRHHSYQNQKPNDGMNNNSYTKLNKTFKQNHQAFNVDAPYRKGSNVSEVDSLSRAIDQLTLKKSVERDGSVKMKETTPKCEATMVEKSEKGGLRETKFGTPTAKLAGNIKRSYSVNDIKLKKTKAMIKSPKKPLPLPADDNRTNEILYHLDQAMCYSENNAALYDKGLILRAIAKFDDAIGIFMELLQGESSLVYLANAYEQCAFCMLDKIELVEDIAEKDKLKYNMKDYFMKAVAISSKLVAAIPDITKVWSSASSLKQILLKERASKDSLKQLAVLSERLNNYQDAISYYEEIINLGESPSEAPELKVNIAKNQMKDHNFVAALTVLNIVKTHPEGAACVDKSIYITCLIEAGFQAVTKRIDKQFGRNCLNSALKLTDGTDNLQDCVALDRDTENIEEEQTCDIFILCDEQNETIFKIAFSVFNTLKQDCGLNVTFNSTDVMLGAPKLSGTLAVIDNCRYFVIFVGKENAEGKHHQLCLESIVSNKNNIVVVREDDNTKLPDLIDRFKKRIPCLTYEATVSPDTTPTDWNKQLLLRLLGL